MNINKAIKKQRNKYFRFVFFMSFIFMLFPFIVIYSKLYSYMVYAYVFVLDFLVITAILRRSDEEALFYRQKVNKFYIKNGIFKKINSFNCDDLIFVHAERREENIKLILIVRSKRNSRNLRPITKKFIKEYPYAGDYYYNLFKKKPDYKYYYIIINRGRYKKYLLLNKLYGSCFNAFYSEDCVNYIKEYRK